MGIVHNQGRRNTEEEPFRWAVRNLGLKLRIGNSTKQTL